MILCERGIRTFETKTRFTLDLCGAAWMKEYSNLPIILDPSWRLLDKRPQTGERPLWIDLAVGLGFTSSNSISATLHWFTNGQLTIGVACGGRPTEVDARRLVTTPPTCVGEVITVESVEGLLIRPERIPGVVAS